MRESYGSERRLSTATSFRKMTFPFRSASYQGTTSVVPKRGYKKPGFSPCETATGVTLWYSAHFRTN
jgi:hypothetical protein